MSKQHPSKIRFADNIYELVRTEAPTAGGSNIRTMHRAEEDYSEYSKFSDLLDDEIPSLRHLADAMGGIDDAYDAIDSAHKSQNLKEWDEALLELAKRVNNLKAAVNKERKRQVGVGYDFL